MQTLTSPFSSLRKRSTRSCNSDGESTLSMGTAEIDDGIKEVGSSIHASMLHDRVVPHVMGELPFAIGLFAQDIQEYSFV